MVIPGREPPLPISNREVKASRADDTLPAKAGESRLLPGFPFPNFLSMKLYHKLFVGIGILTFIAVLENQLIQRETISILFPVQEVLFKIGTELGEIINTPLKRDLKSQLLKACYQDNLKLLSSLRELYLLRQENQELKQALGLKSEGAFLFPFEPFKIGTLISAGNLPFTFKINKGKESTIKEGDIVITSQGVLLGKIIKVSSKSSLFQTIFHPQTKIQVEVLEKDIQGILEIENSSLVVSNLTDFLKVEEGDTIVTSRLSKEYPFGLLIGKVKKKVKSDISPFGKVYLQPFLNLNQVPIYVFLLEGNSSQRQES